MSAGEDEMNINLSGRDEIEALLPFYFNGTLEGEELVRVEAWIASHDDAQSALLALEAEYGASVLANDAIDLPAGAMNRFAALLEAESAPSPTTVASSWLVGLWQKLTEIPAGVAWGVTAAALALVVVQAVGPSGTFGTGGGSGDETFTEAGVSKADDQGLTALVIFAPGSDITDISGLLREQNMRLVDGPKAGGIYQIGIPALTTAEYEELIAALAASPLVAQALPGKAPQSDE